MRCEAGIASRGVVEWLFDNWLSAILYNTTVAGEALRDIRFSVPWRQASLRDLCHHIELQHINILSIGCRLKRSFLTLHAANKFLSLKVWSFELPISNKNVGR